MTEAPLLSEEAWISPMIEEKRDTRNTYWMLLAGEETREGATRGGGEEGVSAASQSGNTHDDLHADIVKWQAPENRDLGRGCYYECLEFRDELCREMRFASSTIGLDGSLREKRIVGTVISKCTRGCTSVLNVTDEIQRSPDISLYAFLF